MIPISCRVLYQFALNLESFFFSAVVRAQVGKEFSDMTNEREKKGY